MSEKDDPQSEESFGEINIDDDSEKPNVADLEEALKAKKGNQKTDGADSEKLKSEYLYLRAEFDNFRKQTIKERSDLIKYGAERFVMQILTVLDNFELAMATDINETNFKDFKAGIEMTAKEFRQVLEDMGVREVDPTGEAFDPMMHDALSSEESSDVEPGYILRVFKKAYKMHEKVIRPAQVVVAKAKVENSEPPLLGNTDESADGE